MLFAYKRRTSLRALCGRVNDNEKRAVLFSRWCNFTYFTHYCLTQCILSMFICRLLFNRRIRHLHLLRCAWALLIKRLLCVIEKKLNACKYSHCNRNIGNTVPWKSLSSSGTIKFENIIRCFHAVFFTLTNQWLIIQRDRAARLNY